MSKLRKMLFLSTIGLTCMTIATGPALAFRLSPPSPDRDNQPGLAAYATGTSGAPADQGMLLSSDEIEHIRWCAKRYMSYHPTDNTYSGTSGKRQECRSPSMPASN